VLSHHHFPRSSRAFRTRIGGRRHMARQARDHC
jgi:hypothetical protein